MLEQNNQNVHPNCVSPKTELQIIKVCVTDREPRKRMYRLSGHKLIMETEGRRENRAPREAEL